MPRPVTAFILTIAVSAMATTAPAFAQSTAASQASAISMEPAEASAAFAAQSLQSGSQVIVTAVRPVGELVEVSVETAGHASVTGLKFSSDAVRVTGLSVGVALSVTAVGAGWLISKGSEAIAFVPDQLACALTHHREL